MSKVAPEERRARRRPSTSLGSERSRRIRPGDLFVALRGGQDRRPRVRFRSRRPGSRRPWCPTARHPPASSRIPWVRVDRPRRALALLAAELYGHPAEKLVLAGRHRHERQDLDDHPARGDPRAPLREDGPARDDPLPHTPAHHPGRPHDARGDAHPGAPRRARRRRRSGRRDRGLLPRARARPRGRAAASTPPSSRT